MAQTPKIKKITVQFEDGSIAEFTEDMLAKRYSTSFARSFISSLTIAALTMIAEDFRKVLVQ